MLKKITIVLGFLVGSILAAQSQSDPSSSLSHLSPGVAISGTDLFYDVQVPGVGGVKVTGTQFLSWVFGNVSGNCTSSISGVFSCTGGNATGIAAGTNIATSGSTVNVTVNTTLTPTFTSVSTTLASVTGWLTAAGVNAQTATIAGILNGSTENLTGNLTGTTGNFSGNLTSTTHQVPGFLTASGGAFQTITIAGNLTAGSGSFATSLTAGTIQATGFLTASGANFTTLTVTGLTPTGPNCLQETGGLLQATNSACSTPAISIAAGSNISTSGTASNVSVSVIPNPTFTSLTSTIAAFPSWITVGGANILTATISGNLTGSTANFSSNLTANIAQFPGFLTASGASLNTATIAGNLTGSTAQFSGLLTGTTAVFQTMTINNLTPTGPNCLQETGGVVQATNAACGSGGGGTPGGATTQVQFNNAGAFAGDAGFTYTTPAAVVITSGLITTNTQALSIYQTWNSSGRTFDAPLFMNITASANATPSYLMDLQVASATQFRVDAVGNYYTPASAIWIAPAAGGNTSHQIATAASGVPKIQIVANNPNINFIDVNGVDKLVLGTFGNNIFSADNYFSWSSNVNGPIGQQDTSLYRDAAGSVLALGNVFSKTTAAGFRLYNTTDHVGDNIAPTNYERGIFDWTSVANQLSIGTQQGGTGVGRNVAIIVSGTRLETISSTGTLFAAAINAPAIAQLGATTTGYACWTTGTGAISEDSTACLASLRRLKKDIIPFIDATQELMALKPSQFQWKDPIDNNQRGKQLGFIAEDVHDVDARLATYDGNGNLHGWRQDAMIAALVRGFQEQQAIIQHQQVEIDELKQRIH